jgi:predicted amidohydrolase YtcJ
MGSIEPGMDASMIIADGNLLELSTQVHGYSSRAV